MKECGRRGISRLNRNCESNRSARSIDSSQSSCMHTKHPAHTKRRRRHLTCESVPANARRREKCRAQQRATKPKRPSLVAPGRGLFSIPCEHPCSRNTPNRHHGPPDDPGWCFPTLDRYGSGRWERLAGAATDAVSPRLRRLRQPRRCVAGLDAMAQGVLFAAPHSRTRRAHTHAHRGPLHSSSGANSKRKRRRRRA